MEGEGNHAAEFDKLSDKSCHFATSREFAADDNKKNPRRKLYTNVFSEDLVDDDMKSYGDQIAQNVTDDESQHSEDQVLIFGAMPAYGFGVRMDHTFKETWKQIVVPKLRQIPDLICMFLRYVIFWIGVVIVQRRKPIMDMNMLNGKQIYGVPIGGIGSGSIGRGFKGQFCRFQMTPGLYTYEVVYQNQFILTVRDAKGTRTYQKVLSGAGPPPGKTLSTWDWSFNPQDGNYLGLHPRAWYTYYIPEENLILKCKQISPVIPHNYKDSCIPACCFVWSIENESSSTKKVSITFTFKNGTGSSDDKRYKCSSSSFDTLPLNLNKGDKKTQLHGVALEHTIEGINVTYGLGCLETPEVSVTHMTSFDLKHGSDIWEKLSTRGALDKESSHYEIRKGELGCAVCASRMVPANSTKEMVFSLVWDQPKIKFKCKQYEHTRRYTRFIESESHYKMEEDEPKSVTAVKNLLKYTLENFINWDNAIDKWQSPILQDLELPDWFKSALFNELYFISDGGTIWLEDEKLPFTPSKTAKESTISNLRKEYGRFAYLEGQEYRMYNTYDVHFYASFALIMLWPKLQQSLQLDFANTIPFEDPRIRTHLFDGKRAPRKVKDSVPHDLGDPWEEPFYSINSYNIHDVSEWRDLNLKFVLLVYRDYVSVNYDKQYLNEMLPYCTLVIKKSMAWDTDGDGLIENSGTADQTYDSWIMHGPSAYCGGLWLASLAVMIEMIKNSDMDPTEKESDLALYSDTLKKGSESYNVKLWTGDYYKFDGSTTEQGKSIMSDQLCGHWLLAMSGLEDNHIFPRENVSRALTTIYENNVMCLRSGEMGAVNGMNPDGKIDFYSIQSEETWTGTTYSLAATMIENGMIEQGFRTAEGIYKTVYELIGQGFETPEALHHAGRYRALGYCRPLSIWSIYHAWKLHQSKQKESS